MSFSKMVVTQVESAVSVVLSASSEDPASAIALFQRGFDYEDEAHHADGRRFSCRID
ncbi:hypothetical protein PR003_g13996 [Phytophthora rubi]|uniref:Uncharacterized protein n=1 Tax=Phytophthora rubi TaxID=129364 RepID=A0A6A3LHU6_9STRA|nr:hypothetical protein PR002_g13338 [Phytophthora rubi]KAE9333481.1 hypothetical protein PR003_g13996 [Phytophthora rubi]